MTVQTKNAIVCWAAAGALVAWVLTVLWLWYVYKPVDTTDTKFIAHRGLSGNYYENTAAAFRAAGESDFFYGIETDIRQTADGEYVCAHDDNPFYDAEKQISQITLAEAKTLPLKDWTSRIATFEEYLAICSQYGKAAIVELKVSNMDAAALQQIMDMISAYDGLDFKFISFNQNNITSVNALRPDIDTHILYNKPTDADFNNQNISMNYPYIRNSYIRAAHKQGREIGVWTVNHRWQIQILVSMGVDYITTNFIF